MPKLTFKIAPFYLQALLDVVEPIERRLRLQTAVSLDAADDDDDDLLNCWRESLLEQLREDAKYLIGLLQAMGPGEELTLTDAEADSALRAASAVRLKIREAFLANISERALETGKVNLSLLGPEEHKPYACYNFLARFQETLVVQLMPEFYGFDESDLFDDDDDEEEESVDDEDDEQDDEPEGPAV